MTSDWHIEQKIARVTVVRLAASPAVLITHILLAACAFLEAEYWPLHYLLGVLLLLQMYFGLRVFFDLVIFRWFAQAYSEQEWHRRVTYFDHTLTVASFRFRHWFSTRQAKQKQTIAVRAMMGRRHGAMALFYKQIGCWLIQVLWTGWLTLL
jgi:hypothetical protein